MNPRKTLGVALLSRGARGLCARAADRIRAWLAWRWTALFARCALGALGLVLLAAIGRSALAGSTMPASPSPPNATSQSPPAAPLSPPSQTSPPLVTATASPPASAAPVAAVPPSPEDGGAAPRASSRRATPDDPVLINAATFEDLRRLPGVGPKRADAILALRKRLGRFRQVEDLLKVKGIGRSTLKKLRPLLRLDAPAAAPS